MRALDGESGGGNESLATGDVMGFWLRAWNGIRSLVQVNAFATRVLRARRWWAIAFTVFFFALGVFLAASDYSTGAWLALAVGVIGLLREAWPAMADLFGTPTALIEQDDAFVDELVAQVRPSVEEERDGFAVARVPHHPREVVLRSDRLDRWLRTTSITAVEDGQKRQDMEARLRSHAAMLEAMLRCRARESYRSDPSRVFFNGAKFGLSDGMAIDRTSVRCHQVEYFHAVVTNEAVSRRLVSDDGIAQQEFSGTPQFPVSRQAAADGERWRLWPLAMSGMADHVGISTLVVTRDRKLVLWNQSGKALHSRNLLAPTGSGSCDWTDVVAQGGVVDLKATLVRAMEREFVEESFGGKASQVGCDTQVLGYFRWIRRGGKPEFVGATRADVDSFRLQPNPAEVNLRHRETLVHDVPDLAALRACLDHLCERPGVSVPLWVNLVVLARAIDEDAERWAQFLGLPVRASA